MLVIELIVLLRFQVSDGDVADVVLCDKYHDMTEFNCFTFIPRKVLHFEIPCYILKMFENLKILDEFRIKRDILTRFLLYVKKGYRDLPYHNWVHAFSVTHFAYLALKNFQLVELGYLS